MADQDDDVDVNSRSNAVTSKADSKYVQHNGVTVTVDNPQDQDHKLAKHFHSIKSTLVFRDVGVQIHKKPILHSVSGMAKPAEILAILGPSGSGKTSLLNALAGRLELSGGDISLNGAPITKKIKRKISYVLQEDIFFANLTLRQTLVYSALLRLPEKMPYKDKIDRVDDIITALDLNKCQHTKIGDALKRGLSGGEKKRANIGCELLTNPCLLLLDEPTSGLDSSSAGNLITLLKKFAETSDKTIVTSIHQPSSLIFYKFNKVMLMCDGHVAYFGSGTDILDHFENIGLTCSIPHYNPADFILEMTKEEESIKAVIIDAAYQERLKESWPAELRTDVNQKISSYINQVCESGDENPKTNTKSAISMMSQSITKTSVVLLSSITFDDRNVAKEDGKSPNSTTLTDDQSLEFNTKWPTSFWTQYSVLVRRNIIQYKVQVLSPQSIGEAVILGLICGLLWFQTPKTEESLHDKMGLIFFICIFWSFSPLFQGLFSFPPERVVINKERSSGSYRLSAYFLAKMTGEIPLLLILPTIFLVSVYWMSGLNEWSFFAILATILFQSIISQSAGVFFGSVFTNLSHATTFSAIFALTVMLLGGFYTRNLPHWLVWMRYLAYATYCYEAVMQLEFADGYDILCLSKDKTIFEACRHDNVTHVPSHSVLSQYGITIELHFCYLALLAFFVIFRVLAYITLRYIRTPH